MKLNKILSKIRSNKIMMKKVLPNNKGIALLIAIFSVGLLSFFAMELSYETSVEYVVASQKINRLKSYYAAKSGAELSLLRVLLYKKALANFGDQLGENKTMLDPIWNFPFAWPPSKFIPQDDVTTVTLDTIKSAEKDSLMQATYITSIESESGKIDLNDLGSDVKALQDKTKQQILKIFALEMEANETFSEKWRNTDFEEVVNNMIDWIDENKEQVSGGDERSLYQDFLKNNPTEFVPPNQPFKSMEEVHMVAGMKDDFYNLLKSRVTVFGVKGINVNFSNKDILKSLDPQITDEIADEIIKRRNSPEMGGPYKNEEDFLNFLSTYINTGDFNEGGIPLLFDNPYNFKIVSTGEFAKASSEITVITYDMDSMVTRMADLLDKQEEEEKAGDKDTDGGDDNKNDPPKDDTNKDTTDDKTDKSKSEANTKKIPKGKPRIVLWQER